MTLDRAFIPVKMDMNINHYTGGLIMIGANKIRLYLMLMFFGVGMVGIINLLILGGFVSVQDLQEIIFIKISQILPV